MANPKGLQDTGADEPTSTAKVHEDKASMLYQVLPAIVQCRMPMLPGLRRSVSGYCTRGLQTPRSKDNSVSDLSVPETPPPDYTSRPASGSTTPRPISMTSPSMYSFDDDRSVAGAPTISTFETATGISWQHAKHGVAGVAEASRQASTRSSGVETALETSMIRSQYLHSLTVLLRSLPSTLTPAEQLNLHAAIPREILILDMEGRSSEALTQLVDADARAREPHTQTALEYATAWLVVKLLFFIQVALPYIKAFLRHAAQFEQDHQVTRRAWTAGLTVGGDVGRTVTRAVCRLNQGIAGDVISNATVYCAESIAGGIQQGLLEAKRARQMGR